MSTATAQVLAVFDLRLDPHALVVLERVQDVNDVELRLALGIVHRGDVHAVVEELVVAHAQQDFVDDGAVHHQIFLADVSAGLADARSVLLLELGYQIGVPRLWLRPCGLGRNGRFSRRRCCGLSWSGRFRVGWRPRIRLCGCGRFRLGCLRRWRRGWRFRRCGRCGVFRFGCRSFGLRRNSLWRGFSCALWRGGDWFGPFGFLGHSMPLWQGILPSHRGWHLHDPGRAELAGVLRSCSSFSPSA